MAKFSPASCAVEQTPETGDMLKAAHTPAKSASLFDLPAESARDQKHPVKRLPLANDSWLSQFDVMCHFRAKDGDRNPRKVGGESDR